jgi:hypothetical protein
MEGCQGWIGQDPVQVPNSYYYRQLIMSGAVEETTATENTEDPMRQAAEEFLALGPSGATTSRSRGTRSVPTSNEPTPAPDAALPEANP